MPEQIDLTTPVEVGTVTTITWERMTLDIGIKSGYFQWRDNLGRGYSASYPTPIPTYPPGHTGPVNTVTGTQIISTINKGNHTTSSVAKKVFTQLQTDGYIPPGAITGTPE
jgi:hypothetical protein